VYGGASPAGGTLHRRIEQRESFLIQRFVVAVFPLMFEFFVFPCFQSLEPTPARARVRAPLPRGGGPGPKGGGPPTQGRAGGGGRGPIAETKGRGFRGIHGINGNKGGGKGRINGVLLGCLCAWGWKFRRENNTLGGTFSCLARFQLAPKQKKGRQPSTTVRGGV